MEKAKRLAFWLVVPLLVSAWLLFGSRSLEPGGGRTPAAAGEQPRYSLRGIEWTSLDEQGRGEFTAVADGVDYFDDESARYDNLRLTVTGLGEGDTPWVLTSPTGEAPPHDRRLSLQGPVDITGVWPDGGDVRLRTPQLWVDPDRHALSTDAGLEFDGGGRAGSAQGLRADWSKQTVQLLGNVRMEYAPRS